MKIIRKTEIDTNILEVGDQMEIELSGLGKFTATVHRVTDQGALIIFDDCVTERPMNEDDTKDGGFWDSDLCKWMNKELIEVFPQEIVPAMHVYENGSRLRIPTYGEMFGHDDYYCRFEHDKDTRLPLMADRKNRICMSPEDEYCWYWLQNRYRGVGSAAYFATVGYHGLANTSYASNSRGVRPAFVIE